MARKRKPVRATEAVGASDDDDLDAPLRPPMTKKERDIVRKFRAVIGAVTGGFQFAEDPGVRNMALGEPEIFDRNVNRRVRLYREGKE